MKNINIHKGKKVLEQSPKGKPMDSKDKAKVMTGGIDVITSLLDLWGKFTDLLREREKTIQVSAQAEAEIRKSRDRLAERMLEHEEAMERIRADRDTFLQRERTVDEAIKTIGMFRAMLARLLSQNDAGMSESERVHWHGHIKNTMNQLSVIHGQLLKSHDA